MHCNSIQFNEYWFNSVRAFFKDSTNTKNTRTVQIYKKGLKTEKIWQEKTV
jgi:hypothetical protein